MKKQKNRRDRNAKISEYRFRRVIQGFAEEWGVRKTAEKTKLSEPAVAAIFMRVRMKLKTNGMFTFDIAHETDRPAQAIWGPKHRGAPEAHKELHEIETITRIVASHNFRYVEKLAVSDDKQWDRVMRLYLADRSINRLNFFEMLPDGTLSDEGEKQRMFDPSDVNPKSTIIVNEKMANPHFAFFRYLWRLLLKSPLDASEKV